MEAASDERHSLLERCLGAESELDRSRSTLVELRRKLDDSQAALQELGRENQSIQGKVKKSNAIGFFGEKKVSFVMPLHWANCRLRAVTSGCAS